MTEQELREQFEKEVQSNHIVIKNKDFPHIYIDEKVNMKWIYFKKGYSLAQETIKAKDAEIKHQKELKIIAELLIDSKDKAIAEARELLLNHIAIFESQGLQWCCKKDIQEAKAWLENNR